jgi:XTP/dITP diphosphohydrolase
VASHNAGKLREFADLIGPFGLEAKSAKDFGLPEPEETGTTFEENAYIKALAAAMRPACRRCRTIPASSSTRSAASRASTPPTGRNCRTAAATSAWRWSGPRRPCRSRRDRAEGRTGRFVAVICLAWPDGEAEYFRGEAEGRWSGRRAAGSVSATIPVFLPEGHERTFGEMPAAEKHGWKPGHADGAVAPRPRLQEIRRGARLGSP